MCFSVPLKILNISGKYAILENNKAVRIEQTTPVKIGDYVRISGIMIVDYLTQEEGDSIRQLIAELNTNYDKHA